MLSKLCIKLLLSFLFLGCGLDTMVPATLVDAVPDEDVPSDTPDNSPVYRLESPFETFAALGSNLDYMDYNVHWGGSIPGYPGDQYATKFGLLANGDKWGEPSFASGVFSIDRLEVPGPCSTTGTAPECTFTWAGGTTGRYWGAAPVFYLDYETSNNTFRNLHSVEVKIKQQLLTGNLDIGFAGCSLDMGFSDDLSTHYQRPTLPVNLDINDRGSEKDQIHFVYYIYDGGEDEFHVNLTINAGIDGSFVNKSAYSTDLDFTESDPLILNGDYITYKLKIDFDHDNEQSTIQLTPIETNKDINLYSVQELSWGYFADNSLMVNGDTRAGIAAGIGGTNPLSKDEVLDANIRFGFSSNGVVKKCEFSDFKINWLE